MGKMVRGISIITVIVFALMVIAGTAAASGIMAPRALAKLVEAAGQQIQAISTQAGGLYKGGIQQLANLFGGANTGDPPGGNHIDTGSTGPGAVRQAMPYFAGLRGQNPDPLFPTIPGAHDGAGGQSGGSPLRVASLLTSQGSSDSGGVGSTGSTGSTGNTGNTGNTGDNKGDTKKDPAKTPIPGAVWLMGTGLIGIIAGRRRRAKA